jgi:hypothetical protein
MKKKHLTRSKWFKNWKTTLTGMVGAGATVMMAWYQNGQVTARDLVIAFALGSIGALAKDFDGEKE